ncbi:MAG TPA: hypothetical protein VF135_00745 [Terriglobales bacterium]
MKPLLKTLAILAFLTLSAQSVRHAYILWLEPRGSVLDKFDQPLKQEITEAGSLDELLRRYEPIRKQVDDARKEAEKTGKEITYQSQSQSEPFKSEQELRSAISEWEGRSKEIRQLRFYWSVGLIFLLIGTLSYWRWNRWFGVTLVIGAFSEFLYWTSPTFLGAGTREFERLLINKLSFSLVSLLLLVAVIWLWGVFTDRQEPTSRLG